MNATRDTFFIGGQWVAPASSKRINLINAATEQPLGTVPEGVEADVDRAVAAAREAFDHSDWPRLSGAERAAVMLRFAAALEQRAAAIAGAVSVQNGMPITLAELLEGGFARGVMQYYAQLAGQLDTIDVRPSQMGQSTQVRRSPVGVVAAIVPWNFPVTLAMSKIAPALAAGCTMVIKPSPGTVLDSYLLAEAAVEAGVPPGVLNWVAADRAVGAYLVSHPGVDKVSFTGSTAAGRRIAATCGELLRPVTLELGGKSAAIVLEDADLDVVLQGIPMACMLNNGQACYNGTRILVPDSRYDEIVEAIATLFSSLNVGDPLDRNTQVGPLASAVHRDRVESYIAKGRTEARLLVGGGRPKSQARGWYVEPTVFADVDNRSVIAQEEIFGPVLSLIRYGDDEEAVRIANDSAFGLGGSVWSRDPDRAFGVAQRVRSGTVGINGYLPAIGAPFGGIKASGMGSEFGPESLAGYQQTKSVYIMA